MKRRSRSPNKYFFKQINWSCFNSRIMAPKRKAPADDGGQGPSKRPRKEAVKKGKGKENAADDNGEGSSKAAKPAKKAEAAKAKKGKGKEAAKYSDDDVEVDNDIRPDTGIERVPDNEDGPIPFIIKRVIRVSLTPFHCPRLDQASCELRCEQVLTFFSF